MCGLMVLMMILGLGSPISPAGLLLVEFCFGLTMLLIMIYRMAVAQQLAFDYSDRCESCHRHKSFAEIRQPAPLKRSVSSE